MIKVSADELAKLPHLRTDQLHGRTIPLLPHWDGKEWHSWVAANGKILPIKINDVVHSDYLATSAAAPGDILVPFVSFMTQRAYWPDVAHWFSAICDDIHNLGTALAKIDFFFAHRAEIEGVGRFVATETEYIFTVCRSFFDLLQETISRLWERIQLIDQDAQAAKKRLKSTFSKMVLEDGKPRTSVQIQERFGLPLPLAEFYGKAAPFFRDLRAYRDGVIHGGESHEMIFDTERGFAVPETLEPFASWAVWEDSERLNKNGLVSLRPALATLIFQTLGTCNDFTEVMGRTIKFPPEIAPGLRLFIRGQHNTALVVAQEALKSGLHWWADHNEGGQPKDDSRVETS